MGKTYHYYVRASGNTTTLPSGRNTIGGRSEFVFSNMQSGINLLAHDGFEKLYPDFFQLCRRQDPGLLDVAIDWFTPLDPAVTEEGPGNEISDSQDDGVSLPDGFADLRPRDIESLFLGAFVEARKERMSFDHWFSEVFPNLVALYAIASGGKATPERCRTARKALDL